MALGERMQPGSDSSHFCQPTQVAVARSGSVFVAGELAGRQRVSSVCNQVGRVHCYLVRFYGHISKLEPLLCRPCHQAGYAPAAWHRSLVCVSNKRLPLDGPHNTVQTATATAGWPSLMPTARGSGTTRFQ